MNIIKTYPEQLSNKQIYNLTMSPKTQKMSSVKGSLIEIAAFCRYMDADKDGEAREVFSILTPNDEVFATNSATFMEDFDRMCDLFGPGGVGVIEVISGTSKAGREFITCAFAGE